MPSFLRRLLGVEQSDFTEGGRWSIDWAGVPDGGDGVFLMILLAAAAVALLWWLYRKDGKRLSGGKRWLLTGLRVAAFAAVGVMLLEPTVVFSKDEDIEQSLIVLVDTSPSMRLTDAWVDGTQAQGVIDALGVDDAAALAEATTDPALREYLLGASGGSLDALDRLRLTPRIRLAQRVLDGGLLDELSDGGRINVEVFSFADGLAGEPMVGPVVEGADPEAEPTTGVPQLSVDDAQQVTAIGGSLRSVLEKYRQRPLAGVLIVSDGQNNQGETPAAVLGGEESSGPRTRIAALAVGTETGPRNARVVDVEVDPVVFVRDDNTLTVRVDSRGMAGESAMLNVEVRKDGGAWEMFDQRELAFGVDGAQLSESFTFAEPEQIELEFRASLTALDSTRFLDAEGRPDTIADADRADNVDTAPSRVIRQELRVLLVAGSTFPEVQFIRNTLLRDPGVELSMWLQSADPDYQQPGDFPIERLPRTMEELDRWDCVVLYDPDPTGWPDSFPELLTEFVAEKAGGLIYIAGEFYTEETFDRATMDDARYEWVSLLPVVREPGLFLSERQVTLTKENPWYLQITPEGERSPIFSFGVDRGTGRPMVQVLPGMYWHFVVTREKPGATVLARHGDPRMEGRDGKRHVLMATQLVGPGRSYFIAFDSTYRWRYAGEDLFDGFWARIVDAAGRNKQLGGAYPFRLTADAETYAPGDTVTVTATFNDPADAPAAVELPAELEVGGEVVEGDGGRVRLLATDEPHVYRGEFTADQAGSYAVKVYGGGAAGRAETVGRPNTLRVDVELPAMEFKTPTLNRQVLADAARPTGGRVFDLTQVQDIAASFTTDRPTRTLQSRQEIWDAPIFVLFILAALIAEWILRKRYRLI